MAIQRMSKVDRLTEEQKKEGYWVELSGNNVMVWHHKTQIALLCCSPDIDRKVQEVVQKRRRNSRE